MSIKSLASIVIGQRIFAIGDRVVIAEGFWKGAVAALECDSDGKNESITVQCDDSIRRTLLGGNVLTVKHESEPYGPICTINMATGERALIFTGKEDQKLWP